MTVTGTCALCLTSNLALRKSHIMPAWVYRRLRSPNSDLGEPVLVTKGTAVQKSKQATQHMLCSGCEQRFAEWERHVASMVDPDDGELRSFPRREMPSDPSRSTVGRVALADLSGLDAEGIGKMATSVIWRAHIASVEPFRRLDLGPYAEGFRRFLLGDGPFPQHAAVTMAVVDLTLGEDNVKAETACHLVHYPTSAKEHGYRLHAFAACGLYFQLSVGKIIPECLIHLCLVAGDERVALLVHPDGFAIFRESVKDILRAVPVGKLLGRVPKRP